MAKQTLSIEQMQHLQELGLKLKETMLYWVVYEVGHENNFVTTKENAMEVIDESCGMLPAYTLQDVLDALPASIKHKDFRYYLVYNKSEGFIGYYGVDFDGNNRYARYEEFYNGIDGLSVIDAAYSMLCWCIEQGYVETNKNE